MKKFVVAVCVALGAMSLPAAAQEVTENSVDANTQKIDSLTEVVNALSSSVQKAEDEALDKKIWKDRAKYFNIYYAPNQSLELGNMKWESELSAALAMGRTYYLPKKALAGMIKFGIDWTFFDLNFGKYEDETGFFTGEYDEPGYGTPEAIDLYQAEIGMGIGPSVTINPVNHLKVSAHFHVTPSFSMLIADGDFNTSYGTFMSVGGAVAYKAISLGAEYRWGKTKYSSLVDFGSIDEDMDSMDDLKGELDGSDKWKTGSLRLYISFRY